MQIFAQEAMASVENHQEKIMRLTFLGTGTSTGVPVIGCSCDVCSSTDERNKRFRSSILLETESHTILVDTGPDLRMQALRHKLTKLDAVIYTHSHMDHVVGFDELRAFCWHRESPLPLYANQGCMADLKKMFAWAFSPENTYKGYVKAEPIIMTESYMIGDITITPIPVVHGNVEVSGLKFSRPGCEVLAYIPDVKRIPETSIGLLADCEVLILDALHYRAHPTHMNISEAIATVTELGVAKSYFTHLTHEVDHATLVEKLTPHMHVAYDGLELNLLSK